MNDLDARPGDADDLLARGYALFFAGMVDQPLLDLLLVIRFLSEDPQRPRFSDHESIVLP